MEKLIRISKVLKIIKKKEEIKNFNENTKESNEIVEEKKKKVENK